MPFGLCNAPSTFQAAMNVIFRSYLSKFILVLVVKPNKCIFGRTEVDYLGHLITVTGVKVDPHKIATMQSWPQPKTITELRGFLRLMGYYRKFVQFYGIIAINPIVEKGSFGWNSVAEAAFVALKHAMTTTPVLGLPNFSEVFVLETDASDKGIGAVLAQNGKPLAYMSKAIGLRQRGWFVYSKEMLAIIEVIRLWHPYLLGRRFQIWTDQKSLKFFLEHWVVTPKQQKWVSKLLGYDYEIISRPGRTNSAADALSRRPLQVAELLESELVEDQENNAHQL